MGFLNWFKKKKQKKIEQEIIEDAIKPAELKDPTDIKHYMINLCEQMIDISKEMEEIRHEYEVVTAQLNDIQRVESLPKEQKDQIKDVAVNILNLTTAREKYLNTEQKISDATFQQMQKQEDELPTIIRRLKENEKYLDSIKHDLNALAAEKIEWSMLRSECNEEQSVLRKLSYFMLFFFGITAIVVVGLSIYLKWDSYLPIIIVAFLATLSGAYVVIRFQECTKDLKRCDVNQNRAISLENRVKIKYVNMKNAVDYACEKYHVRNSDELTYNYEQYIEAARALEKFQQNSDDLEYFQNKLIRILRNYHLYDVKVWVNYAPAILEEKEMERLKDELFVRRQGLKGQITYNMEAFSNYKSEVERYCASANDAPPQLRAILRKIEEMNIGK